MNRLLIVFFWLSSLQTAGFSQLLDDPSIGLKVDEGRLKANRIRKVTSQHLTLFTDLPLSKEVDELGEVFDQGVKQWAEYFSVKTVEAFHATGFLMQDMARFKRAGVIPQGMPDFKNGYTFGTKTFWMYEQPSVYMRRQLMLHEGSHVFLFSKLGAQIPPWFNEGVAELFASHRWTKGQLETRTTIKHRDEAPYWGRTKTIKDDLFKGRQLTIPEIRSLNKVSFLQVEPYAWVWAATAFLDSHPDYREKFRSLPDAIRSKTDLNQLFDQLFAGQEKRMGEQWAAYLNDLDYNVNAEMTRVWYDEAKQETESVRRISTQKSWQNSGISVEAGKNYWIRSKGRFVIRESLIEGKRTAWPCEPNGLSLEYYRGNRLGKLMVVLKPEDPNEQIDFEQTFGIGLSQKLKFSKPGRLYFRLNESPGGLDDNSGEVLVSVVETE
ncbi:MAG: hypothetical protein VX438_14760 [Planctomycetota bacterium]|nr:hypothetical protein [Planctomycetota bacterium]